MELVTWGILGGLGAEVLRWFRIRDDLYKGVPEFAKSWLYWIITLVMVGFGGALVQMYENLGDVKLNRLLAFNIGASAPLIIGSITSTSKLRIDLGRVD